MLHSVKCKFRFRFLQKHKSTEFSFAHYDLFLYKKGRRQVHWQTSLFYLSIKYMTQTLADPNFKPPFHLLLNPALNEYA